SRMVRGGGWVDMSLSDAVQLAVEAMGSGSGEGGKPREIDRNQLEVAILDRERPGRKFRRITGAALTPLLGTPRQPDVAAPTTTDGEVSTPPAPNGDAAASDAAASTDTESDQGEAAQSLEADGGPAGGNGGPRPTGHRGGTA